MLRDLKIFRRNSGKTTSADGNDENVAPVCGSAVPPGASFARAPFNAIQEALANHTSDSERETALKRKIEKTPSKTSHNGSQPPASKRNHVESHDAVHLRTPEKPPLAATPAGTARNRFGWAMKNDSGSNASKAVEDSATPFPATSQLPPLDRGTGTAVAGVPGFTTPRTCKTAGRALSLNSECSSIQGTPTRSVSKPFHPGLGGSRPPSSISNRAANSAICSKQATVDVPHFELREDPSFWMDHNVQVVIRIRPVNGMERGSFGYNRCLKQDNSHSISWIGQPENRFTFDHVACETINQETFFRVVGLPMVENCLSGYNSCIFAYGQTGSGKTYTMLGEINELDISPSLERGMTPRIFEFLFARIKAEEESRRDENLRYYCKCSFLEIYNEQITDLLDSSSSNLQLREDANKGVYVENLSEFQVETVGDIMRLLIQGSANRKIAATNMNRESSRSHSVLTCVIESRWDTNSTTNLRSARLNLVDLAGSERQKTSGAEGERLKEAASINKSLSTLGHVIMVLVDVARGKQRHVPYRDSRLTFLLQDSLGGNSKTMVIANVSPSLCCANETLSTLKFAQRAKLIQNNAIVNEDTSEDVTALQHQIKLLKDELAMLKGQNVSRSLSYRSAIFHDINGCEESKSIRLSSKQLKSVEVLLAGALRREKVADTTIKQLQAEIEQLNRLVRQREEDTQCSKMMIKFREDKIQRMESLVEGLMPPETYLMEEKNSLCEEIRHLQSKIDRHPEVTRFALENIRLLDQLRRFQDFYEEGEREILLGEVAELRNQVVRLLEERSTADAGRNLTMENQPDSTAEVDALRMELENTRHELEDCSNKLKCCIQSNAKLTMEMGSLKTELDGLNSMHNADAEPDDMELCSEFSSMANHVYEKRVENESEDLIHLQLELDILKTILGEERGCRERERNQLLEISRQCEDTQNELSEARSIIEALESQELLLITELEELRRTHKPDMNAGHENKEIKVSEALNRKQQTLMKGRSEQETDDVCRQAEAETAQVIVCLQEEISENSKRNELEIKTLKERIFMLTQDNERLNELIELKDDHLQSLSLEWERSTLEIAEILSNGNSVLEDSTVDPFPVEMIRKAIAERDGQIHDLQNLMEDAQRVEREMEWKLRSLRGAMLAITEAHQQESSSREREILRLTSAISMLQNLVSKSMILLTIAFAATGRASETNSAYLHALEEKELQLNYSEIMHLQKDAVLQKYDTQSRKMMQDFNSRLTGAEKYMIKKEQEVEFALGELGEKIDRSLTASSEIKQELEKDMMFNALVKETETELTLQRDCLQRHVLALKSTADDVSWVKSQVLVLADFSRKSLEDVWLEIIQKDCAASVLNVCLVGIVGDAERLREKVNFLERERDEIHLEEESNLTGDRILEELCFKDIELCILESELREKMEESVRAVFLERERSSLVKTLTDMAEEAVLFVVDGQIRRALLLELEADNAILERELGLSRRKLEERDQVLQNFQRDFWEAARVEIELKDQIARLQMEASDSALSHEIILKDLSSKISDLDSELHLLQREKDLSSASCNISILEEQNHKLQDEIQLLHRSMSHLECELEKKSMEIANISLSHSRISAELEVERADRFDSLGRENKLDELALKSDELDKAVHQSQLLDAQIREKSSTIHALESNISREKESNKLLAGLIVDLKDQLEVLTERVKLVDELEMEVTEVRSLLSQKDQSIFSLVCELEKKSTEISELESERTMKFNALERENEKLEELASKSNELDEAVRQSELLAVQVEEKSAMIHALETKISRERESNKLIAGQNVELKVQLDKLTKKVKHMAEFEEEVMEARNLINQKDNLLEKLADERERLDSAVIMLEEKLEMARALAEEHEAIAEEAKEIAELKRVYAEEKEEEVRLLERSIEELECTVNMLENKVEIVKEEAERQRLQREDLEMELDVVRKKICCLESSGDCLMAAERETAASLVHLEEKQSELKAARKLIETLQKDVENKESEIIQCKAHIAELNLHAEAQARENKQRIKELEAMAQQVKAEASISHVSSQGSGKQEKTAAKSRGSGSPFKCIGLGLTQQMNSEKDEELTAARSRIDELEAMAARRQKEIFMLNARLANAESMTHDVIRDLLGVKLDMTNYAFMLDEHRSEKSTGSPEDALEGNVNEHGSGVNQSEMMAAKTALEGLREREQLLAADNEILKAESAKRAKVVAQLEEEVKRLQREQNLQHRIHHHAKIKEENVVLRAENEKLTSRLRRSEEAISHRR